MIKATEDFKKKIEDINKENNQLKKHLKTIKDTNENLNADL